MISEELQEQDTSSRRAPDPISVAVGSPHYVRHHRFANLRIEMSMGHSPRLAVSRYYWDLSSPVAVDFVRELRYGLQELATKKAYCIEHDIRYILVTDVWAGEEAEAELRKHEPEFVQAQAVRDAAKPLTGPRRRPSS